MEDNYQPWMNTEFFGKQDNFIKGVRLLVLGESHYDADDDEALRPTFTQYVVNKHAKKRGKRFFTNITQLVAGRHHSAISDEERARLWDSIAFYNYVSEIVGSAPRVRPTKAMFERSHVPFVRTLRGVRPDCVLVLGYANWNALLDNEGKSRSENTLYTDIRGTPAACVRHPSSGFNWSKQREVFDELIAKVSAT